VAVLVAAAISIPFFACFRAVGPWYYYGFPPDAEQERTMKVLFDLQASGWYVFDSATAGLIALPSFHTVLAVLTGVALWAVPYVRWFGAALAALIVISTVTTGWHYVSDVLAGLALTLVAVAAARAYTQLEARITTPAAG
jgi:hypothetical protein